jgi:hypothetical protein
VTTERCADCGELRKQTVRIVTSGEADSPGCQDDIQPDETDAGFDSRTPTDTVLRRDNLTSAPPRQDDIHPPGTGEGFGQRARERIRDRRRVAYDSLVAFQRLTPPEAADDQPEIPVDDAGKPPPLTLFLLPDVGCLGCGAIVVEGQTHCRDCDPRTA